MGYESLKFIKKNRSYIKRLKIMLLAKIIIQNQLYKFFYLLICKTVEVNHSIQFTK